MSLCQNLRGTNQRLTFCLDSLVSVTAPEHIAGLLSELLNVGAAMRAEPLPARVEDPELDGELKKYRRNLEKLRNLLPSIHTHLLAERARLEAQRGRLKSASEWARASRQTLQG